MIVGVGCERSGCTRDGSVSGHFAECGNRDMVKAEMPFIERRCFGNRRSGGRTIEVYGELVWRCSGGEWETWFGGKLGSSRSLGGGFGLYRRSVSLGRGRCAPPERVLGVVCYWWRLDW